MLGYTLSPSLTAKWNIQKLRIFIDGENPLMFTKMIDSFDPETFSNQTYPIAKKYSIGLNITF
jgi:hypothetical protein